MKKIIFQVLLFFTNLEMVSAQDTTYLGEQSSYVLTHRYLTNDSISIEFEQGIDSILNTRYWFTVNDESDGGFKLIHNMDNPDTSILYFQNGDIETEILLNPEGKVIQVTNYLNGQIFHYQVSFHASEMIKKIGRFNADSGICSYAKFKGGFDTIPYDTLKFNIDTLYYKYPADYFLLPKQMEQNVKTYRYNEQGVLIKKD